MSGIPGAGLLAMLRKKPDGDDGSKFAARSSAVHAIEQAVAAGEASSEGSNAKGRPIPTTSPHYTFDLDSTLPNEEQPALTVSPVTKVPADMVLAQRRQAAVSDTFITYALKPGHIRVLSRYSEARALLKGHNPPIEDVAFLDDQLLAAGGPDGQLYLWHLSESDGAAVHVEQKFHAKITSGNKSRRVIVASGGSSALPIFFFASGGIVLAVSKSIDGKEVTVDSNTVTSDVVGVLYNDDSTEITSLSASQDGSVVVAGTAGGQVLVWKLPVSASITAQQIGLAAEQTEASSVENNGAITDVHCLLSSDSSSGYLFLAGRKDNTDFQLVHVAASTSNTSVLQTIHITGKEKSYIHVDIVQEHNLIVLADTPRKAIYTLHWSGNGDAGRLDYAARFAVGLPVLNFTSMWNPDAAEDGTIELTCVQTEAVQQYDLDYTMCYDPSAVLVNGGSGGVDNSLLREEECPSPPPTPVNPSLSSLPPPPLPDVLPQPQETTTPRLLTPEDLMKSNSTADRRSPEPVPQPIQILTRPPPAAVEPVLDLPPADDEESSTGGANGDEIAAILAQEMAGVHRKFAGHVSAMYREMLKALRADMERQAAAQQATMATMLREALAAQAAAVREERAAVLAEERAGVERLLTAVNATLNRDLPSRLSEALRAELANVTETMAASVTPAVQQAVQAALPKEVPNAIKSALEKHLPNAVQTGVSKPLQDAFRHSFSKQIVPAFENACQSMFLQINSAFTQGFEEHLQHSRTALNEPMSLANALRDSLDSANNLLRQEQSIMRSSSISSMQGAAPVRSPRATDIRAELKALFARGQYDEAFSRALSLQDVNIVSWLCSQTSAGELLNKDPPALSQMVILSMVQQLAAGLGSGIDTSVKLTWIKEAALALNPRDQLVAPHLKQVLQQVHSVLQNASGRLTGADASQCKIAMHLVHSQMTS